MEIGIALNTISFICFKLIISKFQHVHCYQIKTLCLKLRKRLRKGLKVKCLQRVRWAESKNLQEADRENLSEPASTCMFKSGCAHVALRYQRTSTANNSGSSNNPHAWDVLWNFWILMLIHTLFFFFLICDSYTFKQIGTHQTCLIYLRPKGHWFVIQLTEQTFEFHILVSKNMLNM